MTEHDAPIAPTPAPPPRPATKVEPAPPGKSIFPTLLFIFFVAAIGVSVYAERAGMPAPAAPTPAADPAKPQEAAKPAAPAPPATATVDDLNGVKGEIAALAKKIDGMPKAEPAPDLKPITDKVDALAKSVAAVAEAPKKVPDEVAGKLAETEKTDAALKGEIEALKTEVAALKEAMKAKPTAAAPDMPKPAAGVDAAAMTAAVDLFKAGKYPDALAAFKKLPADDARVLYFTALASGFATNNWKGDTEAAVNKGVEREKAGSPAKADIDAAVGSLTKAQGKDWLDAYRAKAK